MRALLLALGLLLSASLTPFVSSAAGAAESTKAIPILVQLDWIKNAQFAGVLVAEARGWYREAGLDVTVQPVDTTLLDQITPVVKASGIAIGVADGSALIKARQGGAPIKAFGTMFQASPLGIVTLRSSELTSVAALKGKKIGLHGYDLPQLTDMLRHSGVALSEVTWIDVGDDVHSLPAGKIDAQVCYVIDEAVALDTAGHPVNVMYGHENGYRSYAQVYFTTEKTWAGHPDLLKTFLTISNRGWRAAMADKQGTAEMIVARHQPKLAVAYQAGTLALIEPLLETESGPGGMARMTQKTWEHTNGATPELVKALVDLELAR